MPKDIVFVCMASLVGTCHLSFVCVSAHRCCSTRVHREPGHPHSFFMHALFAVYCLGLPIMTRSSRKIEVVVASALSLALLLHPCVWMQCGQSTLHSLCTACWEKQDYKMDMCAHRVAHATHMTCGVP